MCGDLFRAREAVKDVTQFGPLPEIHVHVIDYVTLTAALVLLVGALLELIRLKYAAPLILAATVILWIHYLPWMWDSMTGTMWFATKLGRFSGISWQMMTYQTLALLNAGYLTYFRFYRHS
jgi:hypothetical protein